ncbi:hypothetical protein EON64_03715 [archaeon]|nr:MAG: hypothetical protein EON64_03715 [archaeon]
MKMLMRIDRYVLIFLVLCCIICLSTSANCGPSKKLLEDGSCVYLKSDDVWRGIHGLVYPASVQCKNKRTVQNIEVCEDNLPSEGSNEACHVWSVIASQWCDHFGSLEFERFYGRKGCKVTVFHFLPFFKGNVCSKPEGPLEDDPNVTLIRTDMWKERCFNCWYKLLRKHLPADGKQVHILKLQNKEGVNEDFDGVQFTILSDLFLHEPLLHQQISQIVWTLPINTNSLVDTVGREAEMAWNMWASQQFLSNYAAFRNEAKAGPFRLQPVQFEWELKQAQVPTNTSFYFQSYMHISDSEVKQQRAETLQSWTPTPADTLHAVPPRYCTVPNKEADVKMQNWINRELSIRCHPTRLWVPCEKRRPYASFIPCRQELMTHLAEDYAASQNWCDFQAKPAQVPHLINVDAQASKAFSKPSIPRSEGIRLAFFFTIYTDASFVRRLFSHLYSPMHYYLFHIDASSNDLVFEKEIRALCSQYNNVFISKDVRIVYGASTATILLTKAMAWFLRFASGWDYFVPLTGSDYPLIPLHRIEKIFRYQNPPMPFVMAWTPGTSTHIFRLQKTFPVFEENPYLAKSIEAVTSERGKVLGAVPMEYRSNNFGPPLMCNGGSSFYHLDNRVNKSNSVLDTQWLFPRDVFRGRGRAYANEDKQFATPSADGTWRVWKKSDPATTGAYDLKSVRYIVESEEGRKYWHFFKHMLLGSEEHYYVSLLYNWDETRAFVQTLSAEIVWNTWEMGLWEASGGFQTHTHFLTLNEWDILKGFSLRGMMFARKFSHKKTKAVLDRIDVEFLNNASWAGGLYWPGFYEVDIKSPGKEWIAYYRRNIRNKNSGDIAMGKFVGNVSVIKPVVSVMKAV